jgi:hypothetical protein
MRYKRGIMLSRLCSRGSPNCNQRLHIQSHSIDSARYLGVEVNDALEIAEQTDV